VDITVNLRYHNSDKPTVAPDLAHLRETFGELNHAGIQLQLNELNVTDGYPLGCAAQSGNAFDLCYDASLGSEGVANRAEQKAVLGVGSHETTTASHYLAFLLHLDPLTSAAAAAHPEAYDQNLMHPLPADRGNRLTLGQIYQIHARLGTVPTCPGATTECPPLHADIPR
jgi:hypothetical protein